MIHDRFTLDIIEPLTEKDYYVRGCTALLDAVGFSIHKIDNIQKRLPETHRAGKVIFVITTDGHENSSREYGYLQIKKMIEQKKKVGWEFLFLGANIDAGCEAEKIGIERNRSVTYENDAEGVAINFKSVGNALSKAILADETEPMFEEDWSDEIVEHKRMAHGRKHGIPDFE